MAGAPPPRAPCGSRCRWPVARAPCLCTRLCKAVPYTALGAAPRALRGAGGEAGRARRAGEFRRRRRRARLRGPGRAGSLLVGFC